MKKNKIVLVLSVVASLLFVIFLIHTTDQLGNVEKTLALSSNVDDVTQKIQTKVLITSKELPEDWIQDSFSDQNWKAVSIPKDWVPKDPEFKEGNFAYYRILVSKDSIAKFSHLKNESVVNLYYVLFSQVDVYVNGKFYETNKPTNYNESIIDVPIIENQDNLIAFKGYIKTGDTGVNHRGAIFAGRKAEINELHRKSYKGQTVFSLIFLTSKGSILLIFTLIFLFVKVEGYFEKSLLFSMFVLLEDVLTGDYITHLVNFNQLVFLYDLIDIGAVTFLFLFLADVVNLKDAKKKVSWLLPVLVLVVAFITTDVLYMSKFFSVDGFLKFWNCMLILTLAYFVPKTFRVDKVLAISLSFAIVLTGWSAFFSSNVGHNLKAFANLLIFITVAYQTFMLFRRQQNQLSEQEKDVAIGKTAAVLAHDVRKPLDQMSLILNRIIEGAADDEFLRVAQRDVQFSLNAVNNQIGDMMNFSRSVDLKLTPISLNSVLLNSLKQVMSIAENVDITLNYDFRATNQILGEESRLASAITNILANAVEAIRDIGQSSVGEVKISTINESNKIILRISNSGPHIPEGILPEIFKPLFTSGKPRGTGLGLASVAKTMRDHKGEIKVKNIKDYVEFSLKFMLAQASESVGTEEFKGKSKYFGYTVQEVKEKKNQIRAFVLDDDKYIFEYLKDLSKKCDYEIELSTFRNIEEAEAALKVKRFDLHLIDYDLGVNENGLDFYNRNLEQLKSVVMLHSGREDVELPDNKINSVVKPISLNQFNLALAAADNQRIRVLLIEDSKLIGIAWKIFHGNSNIKVFSSPVEGIEYFKEHANEFEICVVDYYFDNSKLDGGGVINKIKEIKINIPVLLMTSGESRVFDVPTISKSEYDISKYV
jgi:signal transduction histidine kinase